MVLKANVKKLLAAAAIASLTAGSVAFAEGEKTEGTTEQHKGCGAGKGCGAEKGATKPATAHGQKPAAAAKPATTTGQKPAAAAKPATTTTTGAKPATAPTKN